MQCHWVKQSGSWIIATGLFEFHEDVSPLGEFQILILFQEQKCANYENYHDLDDWESSLSSALFTEIIYSRFNRHSVLLPVKVGTYSLERTKWLDWGSNGHWLVQYRLKGVYCRSTVILHAFLWYGDWGLLTLTVLGKLYIVIFVQEIRKFLIWLNIIQPTITIT